MNTSCINSKRGNWDERGFALIVTISMMVLLTLMALAMLSLAGISARSTNIDSAQERAESNARMALMLALGELQKYAGLDTRVTAPADILDEANPPLLGVWRSWEGSDHELDGNLVGRPIQPDYASKELSNAIDEGGRFLSWLVSGGNGMLPNDAVDLVSRVASENTVPIVSSGSLAAEDNREVHVVPVTVDERGAYAWWVSGNNQKALVPKPYEPKNDNAASWAEHNGSHSVADPSVFGMGPVLTDPSSAQKVFTLNTADLVADAVATVKPSQSFHDLSATSVGLLTNVATGGWRKDLSLLAEKWEEQDLEGLELFQLSPGIHQPFTRPEPIPNPGSAIPIEQKKPGSVFYPWSEHRDPQAFGIGGNNWPREHFHNRAAVTSWASLVDFATFYKKIAPADASGDGVPSVVPQSWNFTSNTNGPLNTYHGLNSTWVLPHVARIQMIYSHYATNDYIPATAGNLRPAVLVTPVITLWNPYNYKIEFPATGSFDIQLGYALPVALRYPSLHTDFWGVQNCGRNNNPYHEREIANNSFLRFTFPASETTPDGMPALSLGPGETRVFSPAAGQLRDFTYSLNPGGSNRITMKPGILHDASYWGWYYGLDRLIWPNGTPPNTNDSGGISRTAVNAEREADPDAFTLPPGTQLQADAKYDQRALDSCGLDYKWGLNRQIPHGAVWNGYASADADASYPPSAPGSLLSTSLQESMNLGGKPFMSLVFGSRIATDTNTATKGVVQASPGVKMGSFLAGGFTDAYPGVFSMTNSSWEYSYVYHTDGPGDTYLPNASNSDASGYIITGVNKGEGIDRIVLYDLPVRPMTSLAQLSSWYIKGLNPTPPQAHDIIGNSDATPLIPADNVVDPVNNIYADTTRNEQQDDSYCANHLLFDDWFLSSIAPEPTTIGPVGKTLRDNYIEFLKGDDPLANRAYKPVLEDRAISDSEANTTYSEQVLPVESWKTIASRLEVEGMFNVNSTSVKAWRALLGHARNQKIPYLSGPGQVVLSGSTDYAFPRSGVSSNTEAGTATPGSYFATSEFAGYRVFTEEMLDGLAENIVDQVRLRGPFLSLSEFINRRLSTNEDLAIGGAIQVALNELGKDPSLSPFGVMEGESVASLGDPPGRDDYVFRKAAEGYNTYGLPGWPRQADVLRPLAPILSARDDTFTIRAYGEARDATGKVTARAWCEATVQRTRHFCDPADEADITTSPVALSNQIFGRKFILTSFRWLNASEV